MNNSTYHVKIGLMMTDGFKVGNGLKKGDGLGPNLFNIALEHVIKQLSVEVKFTIFYKSIVSRLFRRRQPYRKKEKSCF
jgi:hypothetical protein